MPLLSISLSPFLCGMGRGSAAALFVALLARLAAAEPERSLYLLQRAVQLQVGRANRSAGLYDQVANTIDDEAWAARLSRDSRPGRVERSLLASAGHRISEEISLELKPRQDSEMVNKVLLTVIELFGLGICGVDRCYMGQTCIGVIKGATAGGLLVWAALDLAVIVVNDFSFADSIHNLGFHGRFEPGTIKPSFWFCMSLLIVQIAAAFRLGRAIASAVASAKEEKQVETPEAPPALAAPPSPQAPAPQQQSARTGRSSGQSGRPLGSWWKAVGSGCSHRG